MGADPTELSISYSHAGEEWLYLLTGTLDLQVDGARHRLHRGDAAHFDAARPHRLHAVSGPAEVLLVVNASRARSNPHL